MGMIRCGALLALLGLAACAPNPGLVAALPGGQGNLTGFVYGQKGESQPLAGAVVRVGDRQTEAGQPPNSIQSLPDSSSLNDDSVRFVAHRFDLNGDGQADTEALPAERRMKSYPGPAGLMPEHLRRFVYLRPGEFFLEGVPEGAATVRAEFGGVQGERSVAVKAQSTVTAADLQLALPSPILMEKGAAVRVLTWSGLRPETGLLVRADLGASSLNFQPSPPDVDVRLKAPPGSLGSSIAAMQIACFYQTPANEAAKRQPLMLGPLRLPLPVRQVAPATALGFGPELSIPVPLGSAQLMPLFLAAKAEDRAAVVTAEITFEDEAGFPIQDANFGQLKAVIPIRRL